jgi:hypothetical protein
MHRPLSPPGVEPVARFLGRPAPAAAPSFCKSWLFLLQPRRRPCGRAPAPRRRCGARGGPGAAGPRPAAPPQRRRRPAAWPSPRRPAARREAGGRSVSGCGCAGGRAPLGRGRVGGWGGGGGGAGRGGAGRGGRNARAPVDGELPTPAAARPPASRSAPGAEDHCQCRVSLSHFRAEPASFVRILSQPGIPACLFTTPALS